jgi:hypothetical protein
MVDEQSNRVTDPITNEDEANGIRAGLEMRKSIPPGELTPVMEEAIALDEARLMQWESRPQEDGDDGETADE